jgi:integrase
LVGKRAKILSPDHIEDLLVFARQTRYPTRNQALVLLSVKAGLRAGEIANLTWPMLAEPTGEIASSLELQDRAAKKRSGRVIPIHPELRAALIKLARPNQVLDGPVIRSERGGPMTSIGTCAGSPTPFGPSAYAMTARVKLVGRPAQRHSLGHQQVYPPIQASPRCARHWRPRRLSPSGSTVHAVEGTEELLELIPSWRPLEL